MLNCLIDIFGRALREDKCKENDINTSKYNVDIFIMLWSYTNAHFELHSFRKQCVR